MVMRTIRKMDSTGQTKPHGTDSAKIDDGVIVEQMRIIHNATPFIYLLQSVAVIALAIVFMGKAPFFMTLLPPLGFLLLSVTQVRRWQEDSQKIDSIEYARQQFKRMQYISVGTCTLLGIWVWSFIPYASPTERVFLAFFTGFAGVALSATLLPRPRMVALNSSLALGGMCLMFFGLGERFYFSMTGIFGAAYIIFYIVSHIFKQRIRAMVEARAQLERQNMQASYLLGVNQSLARTDTLTGVPNRRHFFETLENYYAASEPGALPVVGLVDLDGFKPINDVFGHAAGDAVLIETASRIKQVVGTKGEVARLGGDEFAYILPWSVTEQEVVSIAAEIKDALSQPMRLTNGETNRVTGAVGYSSRIVDAGSAKALLEQADFALYRAKAQNSPVAIKFSANDVRKQRRERIVDQALRSANLKEEIHLVFQPVVDSTTGKIQYCEALSRWNSPELGRVSPAEFIPIAEKSGFTRHLTLVVVRKVIEQLKAWPGAATVSVNLSAHDVASEITIDRIISIVSSQSIDLRKRISIELTEFSLLSDFSEVVDNIKKLRALGVKMALDDFGTGFSSLRYLQEIEFDVVKIDRSFVASVEKSDKSFNLVRIIHLLTRTLAIDCVTEGVETVEQLVRVRAAGGRLIQGFLYAEPLEPEEMGAYFGGFRTFPTATDLLMSNGTAAASSKRVA